MNYQNLLDAHAKYGTNKNDIISNVGYENILEDVVIAPWWSHTIFNGFNVRVEQNQKNNIIYNIYGDNFQFTFLELKAAGAPQMIEDILPLGLTNCKRILFIGSAGSLTKELKIGDLVIPNYSLCGDGASRYLNPNLEDEFLKKEYPNGNLTANLKQTMDKINIDYKSTINFSIDTIFAQFPHIDFIKELGAQTIEMETACFFKCCNILNLESSAIFIISDEILTEKSLFSGRSEEDKKHRHYIRNNVLPNIIIKLFSKTNIL